MGHSEAGPEGGYKARLDDVLRGFDQFKQHVIPLCAAETPISEYVRALSASQLQEKYAMGGPLAPQANNFVGAEHVLGIHRLIIDLCKRLYGSHYADPRPSTGVGAVTNLLMTLSEPGQKIALQTTASGGHASMSPVCSRLGLEVFDIPYDFERLNFDIDALNALALNEDLDFILLSPSDLLYAPPFEKLRVGQKTTVLYDATQTLGLIATKRLPNPLTAHGNMIVLGGTHKTLPGPSSGLILTSNSGLAEKIDGELNPKFLRHSQPNQMAALAGCLIEQIAVGEAYADRIQSFTRELSIHLLANDVTVIQDGDRFSETHQIFLSTPEDQANSLYQRFASAGVTLNAKRKQLFRGDGIRIGVQEIARYRWRVDDLKPLACLIGDIIHERGGVAEWSSRVKKLAHRNQLDPRLVLSPLDAPGS